MLNKIILMGRLARDPEVRFTHSGKPVASLTLAVDRDYKGAGGERGVDWVDVVAWDAKAKFVRDYFTKGQTAVVEGRLQIRDWTDADGHKRRTAEVVAEQIYFAGPKGTRAGDGELPQTAAQPGQFTEIDDNEPLPFDTAR